MEKNKVNKTKQKIMDSAEQLFSEKGFDATSIDDIAKKANTTKSLFYYYFETKNDILYSLMRIRIEAAVKNLAEERRSGEIPKSKEEIYKKCISLVKENENIFKIALAEILKNQKGLTNIIIDLPKEVFLEFDDTFHFSEKEQIELILLCAQMTLFSILQKSLSEKFEFSEEELQKIYTEKMWEV